MYTNVINSIQREAGEDSPPKKAAVTCDGTFKEKRSTEYEVTTVRELKEGEGELS